MCCDCSTSTCPVDSHFFPLVYAGRPPTCIRWDILDFFFHKIFYKTGRLRVIISTANLVDYDWRDIENVGCSTLMGLLLCVNEILQAVWLQDIPPRPKPIPHERNVMDDFPSIMQKILHAVNVRPALKNMLAHDVCAAPVSDSTLISSSASQAPSSYH